MTSLADLVRAAAARLAGAGIDRDEARLDAELLARDALGWDRAAWVSREREPPPAHFAERFEVVVARRQRREPMAYVRGRAEFWDLELEVTRDVLIPRPETELIVELALERVAATPDTLIVDAGTGSGCLAIALARAFPAARLVATDISPAALDVARRNAHRYGVTERISFWVTDLLGEAHGAGLVVSNPPYVPDADRSTMPPEVTNYEPASALFAGTDGLDVIRRLIIAAGSRTQPGGWLLFEIGIGQADTVRGLLDAGGLWGDITIVNDLQSIPRTAVARRNERPVASGA